MHDGQGMHRRTIFWTVVALAGAIMLAVVGAIVFSFVNTEELLEDAGSGAAAYLAIFGLVDRYEAVGLGHPDTRRIEGGHPARCVPASLNQWRCEMSVSSETLSVISTPERVGSRLWRPSEIGSVG